jgi:hypothetical protein
MKDEQTTIFKTTYLLGRYDFTYRLVSLISREKAPGEPNEPFGMRTADVVAHCLLTEMRNTFWGSIWAWADQADGAQATDGKLRM